MGKVGIMMFYFEDCILDTARRELLRGGGVMAVEPKVYEVLLYLVEHREGVVSRDELLEQCWPEAYVSDETLNRCLSRVRRAIGQRRGGPKLIQTVYGSGYRFIGAVRKQAPPSASENPVPVAISPPLAHAVAAGHATVSPALELPRPEPLAVAPPPVAERRHLTVLSCSLVDAERLLAELEPEALHGVLGDFRSTCLDIIARYEGYVAQHLDAGLVVYFGYPQAHEDDAQRAIRAGLAIVEGVRDEQAGQQDVAPELAVRVGIHSGMVIAEDAGGEAPPLAVGATPTIASELRDLAPPQTVVISAPSAHLVTGYFECKALGTHQLAVHSSPLLVYEVSRSSRLQTRLEVGAAGGLTPFVGRAAEVALLGERWAQVQEGLGQVVVVRGDAGIGKSRLLRVLKERIGEAGHLHLECRCSPYHRHTALYPLIDLLQRLLRSQAVLPEDRGLGQLEGLLRGSILPLGETVPLLAALLSLPVPQGRYAPLAMTPQRQRERCLDVLLSLLVEQTVRQPVLFVVEDLHWGDPSTLEFLDLLIGQVASTAMMLVLTCRPTYELPWGQRSQVTRVVLNRLRRSQVEQMITQVAGGKRLPAEVTQQLIEKADGVPLFVEELTRMVLESGQLLEGDGQYELNGEFTQLMIPATLHDSLMARLDRLGTAKEIAQWGSVLGREFTYEVLRAVAPFDEATVQEGMRQLVQAELVFQRGLLPQVHYRFKHALIQDAAYASLLTRRRQVMHERVAQTLEAQFAQIAATEPEGVAYHYTAAGRAEGAISYWYQAARLALQRSANLEALQHLTTGIELLQRLPDSRERQAREFEFQMMLGPVAMAIKGQAAPDVHQVYTRALHLGQQLGDRAQQFPALWGLWRCYLSQPRLAEAREVSERLFALAQQVGDIGLRIQAHLALGTTLNFLGEPAAARTHLERVLALYQAPQHRVLMQQYGGFDPQVYGLSYLALVVWRLGFPEQALVYGRQALNLARQLAHPYTLVFALNFAAALHVDRRESEQTLALAEEQMALATEHGFALWLATGAIKRGWALSMQGEAEAGIAQLRKGLAAHVATGARLALSYWYLLLVDVYRQHGRASEGLATLEKALALMQQAGESQRAAEAYWLKGELLLNAACFQQALHIARRQQAKSLELRAAISLARLWQSQSQYKKAYDLLAPLYAWFSEGFDTADLQAAKALLAALH